MNDNGFVKINRSLLRWEWHDVPSMVTVFVHCLLLANWKDGKYHGHDVPRGSFLTSVPKLADTCGLSVNTVRKCLNRLQETGEIEVKSTHRGHHIFVHNYAVFQHSDVGGVVDSMHDSVVDSVVDRVADSVVYSVDPIEEYKKERIKEKKETILSSFFELYPKKGKKRQAETELVRLLNEGEDETEIMNGLHRWVDYWKTFTPDQERYIPNPFKWLNEKRWKEPIPKFKQKRKDVLPEYYNPDPDRKPEGERMTDEELDRMRILLASTKAPDPEPDRDDVLPFGNDLPF